MMTLRGKVLDNPSIETSHANVEKDGRIFGNTSEIALVIEVCPSQRHYPTGFGRCMMKIHKACALALEIKGSSESCCYHNVIV